jgi:hypothetical protein
MFLISIKKVFPAVIAVAFVLLSACSGTDIVRDWNDESVNASYKTIFVVGISDSQQTRRIFENQLVDELKKSGIMAIPSYQHIGSKVVINRESVVKAVTKLAEVDSVNVDAVLVTYLVDTESETKFVDSPVGISYSGSEDTNMLSSTLISTRGRYSTE